MKAVTFTLMSGICLALLSSTVSASQDRRAADEIVRKELNQKLVALTSVGKQSPASPLELLFDVKAECSVIAGSLLSCKAQDSGRYPSTAVVHLGGNGLTQAVLRHLQIKVNGNVDLQALRFEGFASTCITPKDFQTAVPIGFEKKVQPHQDDLEYLRSRSDFEARDAVFRKYVDHRSWYEIRGEGRSAELYPRFSIEGTDKGLDLCLSSINMYIVKGG